MSENFIKYINSTEKLNEQSIFDLTLLADKYPYFQTAQLLRIKNLHNISPNSIKSALNFTAAYVTDRKILYYLLHPIKELKNISESRPIDKDVKDTMVENISDALSNQLSYGGNNSDTEIDFTSSINIMKEYGEGVELNEYVVRISDEGPELMELIQDEKKTTENEQNGVGYGTEEEDLLLLIKKGGELKEDIPEEKLSESQRKANSLIDSFITSNPKLVPKVTAKDNYDISKASVQENDHYLTDTLAQIYLKQGNYGKAIFAYEKLSLKFPEKNAYFAGQIEEIKKLIDKNK